MKVNIETSDTDITEKLFSKKNIEKVNSDSFASESDDDKITKKKKKKKKSKMDSGLTEEEMEKTKKKKSVLSDSDDAALSCSDDELLQDTELAVSDCFNSVPYSTLEMYIEGLSFEIFYQEVTNSNSLLLSYSFMLWLKKGIRLQEFQL